ncbi:MAG: hypothetical protein R3D30_08425 [Hyphomicrobiales bacterium]
MPQRLIIFQSIVFLSIMLGACAAGTNAPPRRIVGVPILDSLAKKAWVSTTAALASADTTLLKGPDRTADEIFTGNTVYFKNHDNNALYYSYFSLNGTATSFHGGDAFGRGAWKTVGQSYCEVTNQSYCFPISRNVAGRYFIQGSNGRLEILRHVSGDVENVEAAYAQKKREDVAMAAIGLVLLGAMTNGSGAAAPQGDHPLDDRTVDSGADDEPAGGVMSAPPIDPFYGDGPQHGTSNAW